MMMTNDGRLKILDFGLATFNKSAGENTPEKKMFMGTPEYMSPEQVEHPDSVDGRSDLYSLGATLFYMIAGRTMFSGEQMQVASLKCVRSRQRSMKFVATWICDWMQFSSD